MGRYVEMLNQSQMRSHAALLNDAEPVAASVNAFILKFKYEIHCQMAMDNHDVFRSVDAAITRIHWNRIISQ